MRKLFRIKNCCKSVVFLIISHLTIVSSAYGQDIEGKNGEFGKAIEVLSAQLAKDSTNTSALKLRSHCYLKLENYTAAERDLVKLVTIENKDLLTKYMLADVYFKNGKFDSSLSLYRELNNNAYYLTEPKLNFNLAVVFFRLGQDDSALFYAKRHLTTRSDDALGLSLVASILLEHERLDSALYYIEKSIKLQRGYAEAYYIKGNILYAKGKYLEASAELDKAILLEPKSKTYYLKRCAIYVKLKGHLNAMSDCERALCIDPSYAEAYFVKALLFKDANFMEDACKYYRLAVSFDPTLKTKESLFICKW